jgi:hypothetical protein
VSPGGDRSASADEANGCMLEAIGATGRAMFLEQAGKKACGTLICQGIMHYFAPVQTHRETVLPQ